MDDNVGCRILAASIIQNAVKEWQALTRRKPGKVDANVVAAVEHRLKTLRAFFRSPWCDVLLCGEGEGEDILQALEQEYGQCRLCRQINAYKTKKERVKK